MSTKTTPDSKLIDRLFSAGAHFGFQKSRRHPTVKPYLYGNKQGTDIFDLEQSAALLETAAEVMRNAAKTGQRVWLVATKEEVAGLVKNAATTMGTPYVTNRWIGGMITNWSEIKKRINRLLALTAEGESGELERKYTKRERVLINREIEKLAYNFGGVKTEEQPPQLLVVVDPRHDHIAVSEAREKGIPTIGIMSSDNNASLVTHPVLVNDALQASVSLVLDELVAAYEAGKAAGAAAAAPSPQVAAPSAR
jgi:small subunit ribosomal protein S2